VVSSTVANHMNLALYPIDLKFYALVLDTPTTNLEPGCRQLLPPHPPVGEPYTPLFNEVWDKIFRQKVFALLWKTI